MPRLVAATQTTRQLDDWSSNIPRLSVFERDAGTTTVDREAVGQAFVELTVHACQDHSRNPVCTRA